MRRPWLSSLFSKRRPIRRPTAKPTLVTLEDRTTPTVTASFAAGVLTVSLDANDDTAFLRVNGTNQIEVASDSGFAALVAGSPFSAVTTVTVQDPGANTGQSVTFAGANSFILTGGVNSTGIETASIEQTIDTSGGATGVSFSAADGITIDADIDAGAGPITLTAVSGNVVENASASITASAVTGSAKGIDLQSAGNDFADVSGTATAGDFDVFSGATLLTVSGTGVTASGAVALSAPAVSVQADVSAGGIVSIAAVDGAGTGNDLDVAAGVTISTTGGDVTLDAGDSLTLAVGSTVKTTFAGASISLLVDQGAADAGTGGSANTVGADLVAPAGATLTGGSDDDSFTVSGTTAALAVDGGAGTNTFTFDAQATSPTLTASSATTAGKATTTFANPSSFSLTNATGQTFNGTAGDDAFEIKSIGGVPSYRVGGGAFAPIAGTSIAFNGMAGADTLVVDYSGGNPFPSGGVTFDGGGDAGDGVAIRGTGTETATYRPDSTTTGGGVITIGADTLSFSGLSPIDVSGLASFTLNLPNADDVVDVAAGTDFLSGGANQALQLTGTSGGVAFESVAVWNTTTLTIDTTAVDGTDTVTLTSADNAHGITNFAVKTGSNADTVTVPGSATFAGTVDITSGGTIGVAGTISAGGAVTLTTTDAAGTGQDITIAGTGQVISTAGVSIQAGDNLTISAGALVQAGNSIALGIDAASADAGVGGVANTVGADLMAPGGATLSGGADDDSFTVSGTTATLLVDGGAGTNTHTFDAQGTSPVLTASTATTPGKATTTFANPTLFSVVNANGSSVAGTSGKDVFEVKTIAGVKSFQINNGGFTPIPGKQITFNGLAGADSLIVDYSGGDPVPSGGITFDGGGDPDDGLTIVGSGTEIATYLPDAANKGDGVVTVGADTITFKNLTPIDVSGLASFTLNLPNADDVVDVTAGTDFLSGGTNQALQLSGSSGGVAFESVAVWNTTNLTIDTTAVDGKDKITLTSANNAHNVSNLTVRTGSNTGDAITIPGVNNFSGTADILTGGSIGISGTLSTGGTLTLATTDASAAGQDITLTASGKVLSAANVSIQAGDNLSVAAGGQIHAGTSIALTVDANSADGNGGTADLISADLQANSATLAGNSQDDTFNLSGYAVALTVDGKTGSDKIAFNGTGGVVTASGKTLTRTGKLSVTVANVESLDISNSLTAAFTGSVNYSKSITVNAGSTIVSDGATVGSGALAFTNATAFTLGNSTLSATTFDANGAGVTINAGKTGTISASGATNFNVTVDGPGGLTVNAAGTTNFGKNIGAGVKLSNFSTGNAALSGNVVASTGSQAYGDVLLKAAGTNNFSSDSAAIVFGKLNGNVADASAVVINSAAGVTFGGKVGDTGRLKSLATKTGATISGGLVNTQADQTFTGAVTFTADTQLTSATGPITFTSTLDANSKGNKNLSIDAGTGVVAFQGAVGGTARPNALTVNAKTTNLVAPVSANTELFNFTNGMTQTSAGSLTAFGIRLTGSGAFILDTAKNDVGDPTLPTPPNDFGLSANITGPGAKLTFQDKDRLRIDTRAGFDGIKVQNGDALFVAGNEFLAEDASGLAKLFIDLGTGSLTVLPGQNAPANPNTTPGGGVIFNIEIKAASATFGTQSTLPSDRPNVFADLFSIRPSATTPIQVNGNNPVFDANKIGDQLSLYTTGITGLTLTPGGTGAGTYSFTNRKSITYTGIEQLGGVGADSFVVQIPTPSDGTGNPYNPSKSYAIRINAQIQQFFVGSPVQGTGLAPNSFVISPALRSPQEPFQQPTIAFADINGDDVADLIIGNGQDDFPLVTVVDGRRLFDLSNASSPVDLSKLNSSNGLLAQFYAYEPSFRGGVSVAAGNVDGLPGNEIVTGAGDGGGPRVGVWKFDPNATSPFTAMKPVANFFAYEYTFRGGVNVAVGNVDGVNGDEIVIGTGPGGGPRVRALPWSTIQANAIDGNLAIKGPEVADFFAYDSGFRGGVFVAAGSYDSDNFADILTGPGLGGGPHIRVISGAAIKVNPFLDPSTTPGALLANFLAFPPLNSPIPGDSGNNLGVGGVAFGVGANGSVGSTNQSILVGSPRGIADQALKFLYNPGNPVLPGTDIIALNPTPISPPISTLRDGVSVGGLATQTLGLGSGSSFLE